MLQRAGGSLAGAEDGGGGGGAAGGGGKEDRSVWHMWVAVGGRGRVEAWCWILLCVCVCVGGGITAHNLLSRHLNIMLIQNSSGSGWSPGQFDCVGFLGATKLNSGDAEYFIFSFSALLRVFENQIIIHPLGIGIKIKNSPSPLVCQRRLYPCCASMTTCGGIPERGLGLWKKTKSIRQQAEVINDFAQGNGSASAGRIMWAELWCPLVAEFIITEMMPRCCDRALSSKCSLLAQLHPNNSRRWDVDYLTLYTHLFTHLHLDRVTSHGPSYDLIFVLICADRSKAWPRKWDKFS